MTDPASDTDVRIPIWLKLAAFAGLLIVPTVLVGLVLMQIASYTLRTDGRDYRNALVGDIAETVESALRDGQNSLVGVAQMLSNPELPRERRVPLALNVVESSPLLDHAHIFDADGQRIDTIVQADSSPEVPLELDGLPKTLRDRAQRRELAVGPARSVGDGVRALMAVPIRAGDTSVTGYVAAHLPLEPIQRRVEELAEYRIAPSENPVFVIDGALRMLAHPDKSKTLEMTKAPTNHLLDNLRGDEINTRAVQTGEVTTTAGRRMVATVQPLDGLPWAVVVQDPLEVAYASLYRMRKIVWGATGLGLLVALGLAFGLGRSLTRPIDRLVDKAHQLARRDFDHPVDVGTRDELRILGRSMNRAAEDLKASEARIREETEIRTELGRFLPGDLVEGIVRREQSLELGGTRREVTVLFVDIVRFTPLCEELAPEDVVSLLNELFTIMTEIVFRHDGTVDKFVGDAIMAFWGAPRPTDDHAERALTAAEDMIQWLDVGNARWREQYDVEIELAVGVHTGEAVVGNIGSETRMEYTVVGRNVNIAARLEMLANPMQILTTPAARQAAGPAFVTRPAGCEPLETAGEDIEILELIL